MIEYPSPSPSAETSEIFILFQKEFNKIKTLEACNEFIEEELPKLPHKIPQKILSECLDAIVFLGSVKGKMHAKEHYWLIHACQERLSNANNKLLDLPGKKPSEKILSKSQDKISFFKPVKDFQPVINKNSSEEASSSEISCEFEGLLEDFQAMVSEDDFWFLIKNTLPQLSHKIPQETLDKCLEVIRTSFWIKSPRAIQYYCSELEEANQKLPTAYSRKI